MNIYRERRHADGLHAGTTEIYRPVRNRKGNYVLGDPAFGNSKHEKHNQVYEPVEAKALALDRNQRFSIRMKGELTGQLNMIIPENIVGL